MRGQPRLYQSSQAHATPPGYAEACVTEISRQLPPRNQGVPEAAATPRFSLLPPPERRHLGRESSNECKEVTVSHVEENEP